MSDDDRTPQDPAPADLARAETPPAPRSVAFDAVTVAGVASLGAGAIHAAAIGGHSDHRSVVVVFSILATFQILWGAASLIMRPARPWFLVVGAMGNGAALVGWLLAKSTGVSFISGLEEAEAVTLADGTAAALAFVAGLLAIHELAAPRAWSGPRLRPRLATAIFPIAVLSLASMVAAGSGTHADGDSEADHAHGADAEEALDTTEVLDGTTSTTTTEATTTTTVATTPDLGSIQASIASLTACLRDAGFAVDDPNLAEVAEALSGVGAGGVAGGGADLLQKGADLYGLDASDPAVTAALISCATSAFGGGTSGQTAAAP
jgi:hypothetical protein